jgi:hypothetical protein
MTHEEYLAKIHLMETLAAPFVAPVFILPRRDAPAREIITNGTITLVDTGTTRLYVTCKHVWDQYVEQRRRSPDVTIAVGLGNASRAIAFDDATLLDSSDDYDLATLSFPHTEYILRCHKRFAAVTPWPAANAQGGEFVFVVGYPGLHRVANESDPHCTFHSTVFADEVTSSSSRHFILADTHHQRSQTILCQGLPEFGELGGLSGAPAFVNRNGGAVLCGFMYEGGVGTEAIVFIAHASHIDAEGRVGRPRVL